MSEKVLRIYRRSPSENELFLTRNTNGTIGVKIWTFKEGLDGPEIILDDYEVQQVREWLAAATKLPAKAA